MIKPPKISNRTGVNLVLKWKSILKYFNKRPKINKCNISNIVARDIKLQSIEPDFSFETAKRYNL
ncbi:hypothetical protein B0A61_01045 [Flavobacterium aquatile LMG 4008 = ATCC 11947]|uniref:Uncharacterized protein n=1 Tax=Flavobacterium aquatile LMG 4008 = ATCC 11947 TaxID=1453498 RepID=A0A095SR47_9FLAO|nr:hypothetical protein LG45_12550 [Flavobacterium aquatile LMG 4008 = ATCC 11947]OXA69123.1 hypothetical protein B0A61_01045 [Flavobacterium aquatile LMG 4008 = ATCC 11947]GEC78345.1 hypothetical protein FAQ01_12150 [Flavobacterium aquatile]